MSVQLHLEKVSLAQLGEIKRTEKIGRKQVVFVYRRPYFQPPEETVQRYERLMRAYPRLTPIQRMRRATRGSNFDTRLRRRILHDSESIKKLRQIAVRSLSKPVYLVDEKPDRPDVDILISLCKYFIGSGGWVPDIPNQLGEEVKQ